MTVSRSVCLLAWLRISLLAALFGIPALYAAAPPASDWWGSVTWVVDGDTVWVRPLGGGRPVPVRLEGIDAPEICQNGGPAARDALKRQLMRQSVLVRSQARDQYGRALARLTLNGEDPAARLVAGGWVWSYQYRTGRGPYAAQQRQAEAARLGLFAAGPPEEPAAFRERHGACSRPARRSGRR
jgi:endonuclease YncB( thermonuclease family)